MEPSVLLRREGPVLRITLNRPAVRNAIDASMCDGVLQGFRALDADEELRVGVLDGADGFFCSGMDLAQFAAGMRLSDEVMRALPCKPLIAAVEGGAVAGGFELVLACDLIVAADDARFGLPEVRHGIIAAGGGLVRLPRRAPYHAAARLILTGELVSAEEVHAMGLISELAPPGDALPVALGLAERVIRHPAIGVQASVELLRMAWRGEDEVWSAQDAMLDAVFGSEEARARARAFVGRP